MVERKRFSGTLNLDDRNDVIMPDQHVYAKNGRFLGTPQGLTFQNIPGNALINNSLLPAGTNEAIGSFFDSVRQRIIWFNYNSNGNNGIYQYSIKTSAVTSIFICGTDSAGDIFKFSPEYPIPSVQLVYRTEGDGDLLYWTDGNNRPRYLNIDKVQDNAPYIENMINAGKDAPLRALSVLYANDATITTNNLRKHLFRFSYRPVFNDLSKGTFATISKVPLPVDGFNSDNDNNPTINNTIVVSGVCAYNDQALTLGDISGVEVVAQECVGSTWSDFFLIKTIPRSEFTGTSFSFRFVNDATYPTVSVEETDLYFSYVPDKANTLELLNGNVIIYGGITEGYPNLAKTDLEVYLWSGLGEGLEGGSVGLLQNGNRQIRGITGGTFNNVTISIQFVFDDGVMYNVNISLTITSSPEGVATQLVNDLNAEFLSLGISGTVSAALVGTGNTFIITATVGAFSDIAVLSTSGSDIDYPNSVLKWAAQYRWGLIYFDERGKTNGAISYVDFNTALNNFGYVSPDYISTSLGYLPMTGQPQMIPYMMASINHLPPYWAKRFQWVRTPNQTTSSYIELMTNDYQDPGDGFLYFCIQNLTYLKSKNTGFLPSYEFVAGDRVKVIAKYQVVSGEPRRIAYSPVNDFEILGVVTRTMTSPASDGRFLKVKKPSGGMPTYTANSFIEIYTPILRTSDEGQLYFEFGQTFELNQNEPGSQIMYHGGNITDQNATQPATFIFYEGDQYFKPRDFYMNVDDTTTTTMTVMDPSYSDYFASRVNSDGRGWVVDENARTTYNPVLVRWGQGYQQDTNINQLNIFYPESLDTYDLSKGSIQRMFAIDRILKIFQERGVGQVGIYAKFVQDNAGQQILTTTDQIITTNNINYYQGGWGVGSQPCTLVNSVLPSYFCDPVRGYQVRNSGDGNTPISELYKGQFYIRNLIMPFGSVYTRSDGYKARINGAYDYFDEQYLCTLQAGIVDGLYVSRKEYRGEQVRSFLFTFQGTPQPGDTIIVNILDGLGQNVQFTYTVVQGDTMSSVLNELITQIESSGDYEASIQDIYPEPGILVEQDVNTGSINATVSTTVSGASNSAYTFSFNEKRNAYCSFYDFFPEWITSAQDVIYSWVSGQLYSHNSGTYNNFYGTQFDLEIDLVFNQNLFERKTPLAITETCNTIMTVPLLYTDVMSFGSQRQESNLVEAEFQILEGKPSSAFKRDVWSRGGKINGGTLKSSYLYIKLRKQNASELVVLSEVDVKYIDSPFNAT